MRLLANARLAVILYIMARTLTMLGVLIAIASMAGCASSVVRPAAPPAHELAPRTEAPQPEQRKDAPPRLIAPPPAYGNKVVQVAQVAAPTGKF